MAIDPVPNTSEVLSRDGKPSRVWFLWFSQLREQVNSVVGGWVPAARKILTSLPLRGGGDLSQDRTLSVDVARANSVGVVKPDGVSTTVSPDGTLSAIAASSRPSGPAGGDLTGNYPNPLLRNQLDVNPGPYVMPSVTVDGQGRITEIANGFLSALTINETPDGVITTFTLTHVVYTLLLFWEGQKIKASDVTFVPGTNTFTLSFAPPVGANLEAIGL